VRPVGVGRRVAIGAQLTADEREAERALLEALQYTAAQGIIHRDLKPANVLFASDGKGMRRLVVGDFGLARFITDRVRTLSLTRRVGTPLFYAPEVDNEESYGLAADIFSCGLPAATPCRLAGLLARMFTRVLARSPAVAAACATARARTRGGKSPLSCASE